MADKEQSKQPSHRAYTVIRREGQDDFWLNIGLAFMHNDGKGLNIMLQAMPLDGKIVLREAADDAADEPSANRTSRRGSRSERR